MKFDLRGYQKNAVNDALEFLTNPFYRDPSCLIGPTGMGKSLVVGKVASELSGRVLVLQPARELLTQNFKKFMSFGGIAGVYAASFGKKQRAKTTFALLGSIVNKPQLFEDIKYLVMDEAHLYPPSGDSMFRKFMSKINPDVKVLGLTASPFRLVTVARGDSRLTMLDQCDNAFFKHYCHTTQIQELTQAKPDPFWCPLEYIEQHFDFDGLVVNKAGNDYTEDSLVEAGAFIENRIIEAVTKLQYNRALIFVSSVAQAARLASLIPGSAYVSGETPEADRDKILLDYSRGKIRNLFNVNVLAVGFDDPATDCVICAHPTMSGAKFYQWVGRGTRPHPSKKVCLVVDLAGNLDKFGQVENFVFKRYKGHLELFSGDIQITGRSLEQVCVKRLAAVQIEQAIVQAAAQKITIKYDDMVVSFGKHLGKKLSEIPEGWLMWAQQNIDNKPKLIKNIALCLAARKA